MGRTSFARWALGLAAFIAVLGLLARPASTATYVTVEGDTVVINVPIEIFGGNPRSDQILKERISALKTNVEQIWNEAFDGFTWACWKFRLELDLIQTNNGSEKAGYHQVEY